MLPEFDSTRTLLRFATVLLAAAASLGVGQSAQAQAATSGTDAKTFERIAAVLQHQRCLNCHQPYSPLQGEQPRRHTPPVVRGADDRGAAAMRCASCHRETNNVDVRRARCAALADRAGGDGLERALDAAQLCRTPQGSRRNGGRSLHALVEHMEGDALVRWGWNPGGSRAPVPVPHQQVRRSTQNLGRRRRTLPGLSALHQSIPLCNLERPLVRLDLNGKVHQINVDPEMPLLWALRDKLNMTGTKYGCGRAQCGACTVHIDGEAVRSCSMSGSRCGRPADHDHRGASRAASPKPCARLAEARRGAMRLLPVRPDHVGHHPAHADPQADGR